MGYFFSFFALSKSATTGALNWSEVVLLVFGIVLVVGLVGEYKSLPHTPKMKFFEMLVIIGVLGELLGDGGVFLFSNQLQVISDAKVAELMTRAGKAEMEAAELEAQVAWRRLAPKTRSEFSAHLKRFHGQPSLISYIGWDIEANSFALDIAAALEESGWPKPVGTGILTMPKSPFAWNPGMPMPIGIKIWYTSDSKSREAAEQLEREFNDHGFDVAISPDVKEVWKIQPHPQPASVMIAIAPKPFGPQGEFKLQAEREARAKKITKSK